MNKLVLTSNDQNVVTQVQLFAQANGLVLEVNADNVVSLPVVTKVSSMQEMESALIQTAITQHKGNLTAAAKSLKIGRATLYRKVKEYNLSTKEFRKTAVAA